MTELTISPNSDRFVRGDTDTFVLGDTLWAAFTRVSLAEWRAYLAHRRAQGFNAVYISVLPIAHDRSVSDSDHQPFHAAGDGGCDLSEPEPAYFERAEEMVRLAVEMDLTPFLVLLWCSYVPDNWASEKAPELVFDDEQNRAYLDLAISRFAAYRPVFVISGDDHFTGTGAVRRYAESLDHVRAAAPDCLTTMHAAPQAVLPDEIVDAESLDFYAYQSGHDGDFVARTWELAEQHRELQVTRPIVNMEPCYEGHGHRSSGSRHTARDVRRASWSSILAGAGAGLGYAAHGVWQWHRPGDRFLGEHFSGRPFAAHAALDLPGAWDVGLLRHIVERHALYRLQPAQDLLVAAAPETRVGTTAGSDTVVVYTPDATPIELDMDLTAHVAESWELTAGRPYRAVVSGDRGTTRIDLPPSNSDSLHVFRARD